VDFAARGFYPQLLKSGHFVAMIRTKVGLLGSVTFLKQTPKYFETIAQNFAAFALKLKTPQGVFKIK
jgi:hypothetical protein